jgi:hypothetical protein
MMDEPPKSVLIFVPPPPPYENELLDGGDERDDGEYMRGVDEETLLVAFKPLVKNFNL